MKHTTLLILLSLLLNNSAFGQSEIQPKPKKIPSTKVNYKGGTGMIRKVILENMSYPTAKFFTYPSDSSNRIIPIRAEQLILGTFGYPIKYFKPKKN